MTRITDTALAEILARRGYSVREQSDAPVAPSKAPELLTRKAANVLPNVDRSGAPLYPLVDLCRISGLNLPVPEYKFHPTRRWRFDYSWPLSMLALEIEGGIWTQGRHTRGAGMKADMEKYSEAAILGWRILYITPDQIKTEAIDLIARALRIKTS